MAKQEQMPSQPSQYRCGEEEDPYSATFSSTENIDPETTIVKDFTNKKIRLGFIRKVYGILLVQLAITGGIMSLFRIDEVKNIVQNYPLQFLLPPIIVMLITLIVLTCFGNMRRRAPCNYILLFTFTISMGVLLGIATSFMDTKSIFFAVGITGGLCLGLTIFSFQTKWDFTLCGGWLLCVLIVFIMCGCITPFYRSSDSDMLQVVYSSLGVLLFSFYLIYDTQLILGGNHRLAFSPEEYIFAALILYLDTIRIFLYILRFLRFLRFLR